MWLSSTSSNKSRRFVCSVVCLCVVVIQNCFGAHGRLKDILWNSVEVLELYIDEGSSVHCVVHSNSTDVVVFFKAGVD